MTIHKQDIETVVAGSTAFGCIVVPIVLGIASLILAVLIAVGVM